MKWMGQEKMRRSMDEERIDAEFGYARRMRGRYEAAKNKAVPEKGTVQICCVRTDGLLKEGQAYYFWWDDSSFFFFPFFKDIYLQKEAEAVERIALRSLSYRREQWQVHKLPTENSGEETEGAALLRSYKKKPLPFVLRYRDAAEDGPALECTMKNTLENIEMLAKAVEGEGFLPYYDLLSPPKEAARVQCIDGKGLLVDRQTYTIWIDGERLHFLYDSGERSYGKGIGTIFWGQLPLKAVLYYQAKGDLHRETKITSGGGVEDPNRYWYPHLNALVDLAYAVEPAKWEEIVRDERYTLLSVVVKGCIALLRFGKEAFAILEKLLPKREYDQVIAELILQGRSKRDEQGMEDALDVSHRIRELARLREDGLLTEAEFTAQKEKLLEQI